MPEVFTTNGNLMRKAFVSLGSLELEKFEVVGVVHKTNSNLDFINVENGRHKSVTDDETGYPHPHHRHHRSTGSHPDIFIVDQFPNILSRKTFYFHSTNDTESNNNINNKDSLHVTTTTTTTTPVTTTTPINGGCVNNASSYPKKSDRIKRGKINRSVLIPTDRSLDSHILLSRSENTNQLIDDDDNKPSISSIGCMITDRRSSSSIGGGGGGSAVGVGNHNHSDNNNNIVKNNNKYHLLYTTNGIVSSRSHQHRNHLHLHKPSTDSEISTMDNSISGYLFGTTPPIGQASLFNLNNTNTIFITHNNANNDNSNSSNNIDYEKGAELNTNTSKMESVKMATTTTTPAAPATSMNSEEKDPMKGEYFVIMKNCDDAQSHKPQPVLSINNNNNSNGNGVNGLKYLQGIYSKWNVFPVYIESEKMIQSNSVDKSFHNEDSDDGDEEKRTSSTTTPTPPVSHHQHRDGVRNTGYSIFNPVRSLIDKMKQRWSNCRIMKKKRKTVKSKRLHHHHHHQKASDSNFNDMLLDSYTVNSNNNNNTNNSNNYEKHRRQTIITNASIFSLPAIPPALWNAERPVWIMGVPLTNPENDDIDNDSYSNNNISDHWFTVDTNKLILLKRQQLKLKNNNQNNLTDLQNLNITGSSSSIYAFHVRPPPRLKPATTSTTAATAMEKSFNRLQQQKHSHTRARSVGQMLTCDKSQT
ncbi:unnamed protein product [Trichobilharzia regenti]|nr:unnamed protein product [Trichobilharzia regenti]